MKGSKNTELKRTSLMVHEKMFDDFKTKCIVDKFNLQKLSNRAMHMYLENEEFRELIRNYNKLITSGSL